MSETVSRHRPRSRGDRPCPELVLAMEGGRPLALPERIALADVDAVALGRGAERAVIRKGTRRLAVEVADTQMSAEHARLVCAAGDWMLEDLGSKNGTFVGGVQVERVRLADGDVVELGATFFVFRAARTPPGRAPHHPHFATCSSELAARAAELERIAATDVAVLLRGETGTGKELAARAVHELSKRRGAFVAVNCGALVETLAQSELFGYRRGAFSGATEDRSGLVRAADKGTLFLDEIGDMPAAAQAVLLRVLEESEVKPLGAVEAAAVDIRVVAATHRDLDAMIQAGTFRADLLARLAGFDFHLLPLRERREDMGLLVARLLERRGVAQIRFDAEAVRALFLYDWPLNIRELDKAVARAVTLADDGWIGAEHLPLALQRVADRSGAGSSADDAALARAPAELDEDERRLRDQIVDALARCQGSISAAARELDKDRKQIRRWIKRFGIEVDRFRPD